MEVSEIEKKVIYCNHDKYITTPELNNLVATVFTARLSETNLVTKTDFDTKLINLNRKINSSKTKHVPAQNEFKQLEIFDSIYVRGKVVSKKIPHKII